MREPSQEDVALLWAACAIPPDLETASATAGVADLNLVLEVASHHRVGPLVLRALSQAGVPLDHREVPSAAAARVWEARAAMAVPAACETAFAPLCAAGLAPLVLKGLSIGRHYPAPELRPMDDMDILLPRDLAGRALTVLLEAGWKRARHGGRREAGYDAVLVHPSAPGVPLELHHQLSRWRELPRRLHARRLWGARRPAVVHGHPVWALPPEIELVVLVAHASKPFHLFDRLLWAVDLSVAAGRPDLDWDEVAHLLRSSRRRIAGAVGLRLASRLGASVPEDLLILPPAVEQAASVEALLDPARPFRQKDHSPSLRYGFVDGMMGKVRLAAGEVMRPPRGKPRHKVVSDVARITFRSTHSLVRGRLRLPS